MYMFAVLFHLTLKKNVYMLLTIQLHIIAKCYSISMYSFWAFEMISFVCFYCIFISVLISIPLIYLNHQQLLCFLFCLPPTCLECCTYDFFWKLCSPHYSNDCFRKDVAVTTYFRFFCSWFTVTQPVWVGYHEIRNSRICTTKNSFYSHTNRSQKWQFILGNQLLNISLGA